MEIFGANLKATVFSPAGAVDTAALQYGISALESFGFQVVKSENCEKSCGYLSADADLRFADIKTAWLDESTDILLASRGGFGCSHLLPYLSSLPLKDKKVAGYSDLTALLWALEALKNGHTLALPMAAKYHLLDDYSLASAAAALHCLPRELGKFTVLKSGNASGLPLPGNLTVAASLAGTPFMPDTRGRILILEDVNEPLYRIDRALTQLDLAGVLPRCAGIVFGTFSGVDLKEDDLLEVLCRCCRNVTGPVLYGCRYGHTFPFESFNCRQMMEISDANIRMM